MISVMLRVPVRAQKTCTLTRPWKCLMRKRSWDGVRRVGTDLTVLYATVPPAGQNLSHAPDFHDFELGII